MDGNDEMKKKILTALSVFTLSFLGLLFLLEAGDRIVSSFRFGSARYLVYPLLEKGAYHLPSTRTVAGTVEQDGERDYNRLDTSSGSREDGISVNSQGFRGKEFSPEKPSGIFRIICTGGSSTFSSECKDGESYPEQLEALLNSRSDQAGGIEVVNAGFEGYRTDHILKLMKTTLLTYQPDCITVCEAFNNVSEQSLVLDTAWKKVFWKVHSALFQKSLFYSHFILWMAARGVTSANLATGSAVRLARYRDDLTNILSSASQAGVRVVFILQPLLPSTSRTLKRYKGLTTLEEESTLENEYLNVLAGLHTTFLHEMGKVAGKNNVVVIDPQPAFNTHPNPAALFTDFVHLSPSGSRVMAEEISKKLLSEGLVPAR